MAQALSLGTCAQLEVRVPLESIKSSCLMETVNPSRSRGSFDTFNNARFTTPCKWSPPLKSVRDLSGVPTGWSRATANRFVGICNAKSTDFEKFETTEERIARLVAANEKMVARLAELEDIVSQFKATALIETVESPADSDAISPAVVAEDASSLEVLKEAPGQVNGHAAVKTLPKLPPIEWPSPEDEIPFWKRKRVVGNDLETTNETVSRAGIGIHKDNDPVYVVHITAEMAPVAKVGGLGDVVTGLGRACLERGHKVLVMLPFYECIDNQEVTGLTEVGSYSSYHKGSWVTVKSFGGKVAGVPVLLLQPVNQFFKGPSIYGGAYDELEAYLFFCRASLERMQVNGDQPDIIHIHEWHMGAVAMLYWDMYNYLALKKPRLVLTIHNMEHYGGCRLEQLSMCGLDGSHYREIDKAVDERTIGHNPERLSLLKGGIVYSNAVTTVSPTYANETLCSGWMANTLLKHRSKYSGILNGIDTVMWDPASDPALPMGYSAQTLLGKQVCKQYVQRGLGLEPDDFSNDGGSVPNGKRSPLAVCIARLVAQKGIHLIRHAINHIGQRGGQFVLLGTAPDPRVQAEFESLARELAHSKDIRLLLFYSEELAHMLYAAADIVLVPSMFEPCGLTQMIGLRYGAIPVVRRTGGLADTVFDVDDASRKDKANGFVFDGITEDAFDSAFNRSLDYYKHRREWWEDLTCRAMKIDYSWNKSAQEYLALYNSVRAGS